MGGWESKSEAVGPSRWKDGVPLIQMEAQCEQVSEGLLEFYFGAYCFGSIF